MDINQQNKHIKTLRRNRLTASAFTFIFAALAVLSMIGIVIAVLVIELRGGDNTLLYILCGSFGGGAVVFALAGFGFGKLSQHCYSAERDFRERCVSEESFFVGDGTLATFSDALLLHDENTPVKDAEIVVPYSEVRFFSVCTRRAPREKGEWSVVIEIPAHYLKKDKKVEKNAPPALVQTDAKPRLYDLLNRRGFPLLGEEPPKGKIPNKKFKSEKKFIFPVVKKRRRAILFLVLGAVAFGGGIALAFTVSATVGAVGAVFGAFIAGRAVMSFVRAKGLFAFYDEGIWWRDSERTDSIFLKWHEIEKIYPETQDGVPLIVAACAYGNYRFPSPDGAFEYVKETHGELCGGKK